MAKLKLIGFGLRLKAARLAAKLSQAQLAEKVGMSASTIWKLERGQNDTTIKVAAKLARACGSKLAVLVSDY